MKPTTEKYFIYALSSIIYGALMFFDSAIISNITLFYVTIVSAFLGIDVAYTLKETNKLPDGEYKDLKKDRYIITAIVTGLLLAGSIVMTKVFNQDLTGASATLGATLFLVFSVYIGALEGVKLLTGSKPDTTTDIITEKN